LLYSVKYILFPKHLSSGGIMSASFLVGY
jgi:hypothetical protein